MKLSKERVRTLTTPKGGKFSCGPYDLVLVSSGNEEENEDGGPGSGNFNHKGVPGQVGGSAPSYMDMIPSGSYTESNEYKSAVDRAKGSVNKYDKAKEKLRDIETRLKAESKPKPKSDWDDEDLVQSLIGERPMILTEKGRQLQAELKDAQAEMADVDHERSEALRAVDTIKRAAREEQLKDWSSTMPHKAGDQEFEGFSTTTTGTSYSDHALETGKGYIAKMSPEEYIQRCAYDIFDGATIESTLAAVRKEPVEKYAEMMGSGTKFDMPYLDYSRNEQEGRHRALAAYSLGIEEIPVLVIGYGKGGSRADGGPGSGNHGHAGIPGEVGGSMPGAGKNQEYSEEYIKQLPAGKIAAVKEYTSYAYSGINSYMRGSNDYLPESHKQVIEDVKSAIEGTNIPDEITTFRGTDISELAGYAGVSRLSRMERCSELDKLKDREVEVKSFLSTSEKRPEEIGYSHGVEFVVTIPKGGKALTLGELSKHKNEAEVLLPPRKYKITDVDYKRDPEDEEYIAGKVTVYMEQVRGDSKNTTPYRATAIDGGPGSGNFKHEGRPGEVGGSTPSGMDRTVATGKDISTTYKGKGDIKSVLRAQGYEGLPKIASRAEFDAAVKASSFIAQRTYSASSQEVLDAYREQLYNGEFYVECTDGGAQYGKGMYCAADYRGELTEGIKAEMKHYQEGYRDLGEPKPESEWLSDADKALSAAGIDDESARKWAEAYFERDHDKSKPLMEQIPEETRDRINNVLREVPTKRDQPNYTETMTLDPSAKIVQYGEIDAMYSGNIDGDYRRKLESDYAESQFKTVRDRFGSEAETYVRYQMGDEGISWDRMSEAEEALGRDGCIELRGEVKRIRVGTDQMVEDFKKKIEESSKQARERFEDVGAYAAACGYDAINAEGHGESGSYTVVLNRTKLILLDGRAREDGVCNVDADNKITFQIWEDGLVYAIRDGEIIGWVATSEGKPSNVNAPKLATDAGDVEWVTINGTHTPLKNGEAVGGGKLKGMKFSSAKSEKNKSKGKNSALAKRLTELGASYSKESKKELIETLKSLPAGTVIKTESPSGNADMDLDLEKLPNGKIKATFSDGATSVYAASTAHNLIAGSTVTSIDGPNGEMVEMPGPESNTHKKEKSVVTAAGSETAQKKAEQKQPSKKTAGHKKDLESYDDDPEKATNEISKDAGVSKSRAEEIRNAIDGYGSSEYTKIRAVQSGISQSEYKRKFGSLDDFEEMSKYGNDIEDYISKAPAFDGPIYRCITVSKSEANRIAGEMRSGKEFAQKGTSSWTSDKGIAETKFAFEQQMDFAGLDGVSIIFSAPSTRQGTSVAHLTGASDEREVLVSKDATWKPKSVRWLDGMLYVSCNEVTGKSDSRADGAQHIGGLLVFG